MSHFAKVEDSIVVTVIVADQEFVNNLEGTWIQTSFNTYGNVHRNETGPDGGEPLRKNFAGVGFTYDATADAFHEPSPYPSWILDTDTFFWEPPVEKPDDSEDGYYVWDEDTTDWVLITE